MSRANLKISTSFIGDAILSLRRDLRLTQEQMARRLDCKLRGYQRWERGVTVPSGYWLLKILELCPDVEAFAEFGLDIAGLGSKIASTSRPEQPIRDQQRLAGPAGRELADIVDRSVVPPVRSDGRIRAKPRNRSKQR